VAPLIVPERFSPRFAGGFDRWYLRGLVARSWHSVRLAEQGAELLDELGRHVGPAIVLMNHQSWWDPLVGLWIHGRFEPTRRAIGPMEATQLAKFGFFKRLGVFGIEPDAPGAIDAMTAHVSERFIQHPKTTLWLTPQGTFADVRTPIRLRPGAAAIAARALPLDTAAAAAGEPHGGLLVLSVAMEYAFWLDRKPELLLRAARISAPTDEAGVRPTTGAWNRAMTAVMHANAAALAALVVARDPAALRCVGGKGARNANNSRVWDWWLRLRGGSGRIDPTNRDRPPARPATTDGTTQ